MNAPSTGGSFSGRRLWLLGVGLTLTLAASACSGGNSDNSGDGGSQKSSAALVTTSPPAKSDLDHLTWDLPTGEPTTLDYVKAGDYSPDTVISNLCDSLLRLKPDFSIGPNLATAWKYSPDHLTLTYSLRSGVTFWDGKPLTSADVVYSMHRNTDPKNDPINGGFYANVASIDANGPHQVVVHFKKPDELFNKEMSTVAGDVSEMAFTKAAGSKYGTAQGGVMCSGPFKLDKWSAGSNITLSANENYWNPEYKPRAKSVTIDFITDTSNLVQALKSGEVDGTYETPTVALPALTSDGGGNVYQGPSLAIYELVANAPGPGTDPKIKQALGMVIDRAALAKAVFNGAAEPNYTFIPKTAWDPTGKDVYQKAWDALDLPTTVDVASAKKVIAGDPNASKDIRLALLAGDQTEINTATLIQQEAASIGLHVKLVQLQPLQFSNAFYVPSARKGIDLILTKGYLDVQDPLDYLGLVVLPTSLFNWIGYSDATVTQNVAKAISTFDDTERAKLITQAQAQYEGAHFMIPMLSLHEVLYMNKKITGAPVSFAYIYEPSLATVGGAG
jgi:peptide/nickel transport system substrate-binding protein